MKTPLFVLLVLISSSVFTQAQEFSASVQPAQLVELFTSQGCSSCPSAERWLNGFKEDPDLWVTLFPLAWHVNYWDSLGWVDKFSSAQASHRQYRYHHQTVTSGVYTPQAVLNGLEWRALLSRPRPELPEAEQPSQPRFTLLADGNQFTAQADLEDSVLNLALIGMDFHIKIKRGENSGRVLEEQFVVLGFAQYAQQGSNWQGELPATKDNIPAHALVAWVTQPGSNLPLSITGGLLKQTEK